MRADDQPWVLNQVQDDAGGEDDAAREKVAAVREGN